MGAVNRFRRQVYFPVMRDGFGLLGRTFQAVCASGFQFTGLPKPRFPTVSCFLYASNPVRCDRVVLPAGEDHLKAVGYLIKHEEDETVIQTLDGKEERWSNVRFYAVPGERKVGSADEMQARAKEFAAEGEVCSLNHFAKVVRFFGMHTYGKMISLGGKTYNVYQRMTYPSPGDLVIENTAAFWAKDDAHLDAVGYLFEKGAHGGRLGREKPTRILTLDGREVPWTNASFWAIPAEQVIEDQPPEEERFLRGEHRG
jgi:hypothetical protein